MRSGWDSHPHSPCAEGERIERPRDSRPDLRLATGCLTSSASLPYAGRDLHPHVPFGTRASGARASAFRHQRLEWPARFELALRPWQGRVLPLTLRPHGASGEIRTHDLRLTEAALCPLELQRQRSGSRTPTCGHRFQGPAGDATHPGMEPSPGADPGLLPYRGRVTAVCDGGAPAQAMAVASASRTRRRSPCLRRCLLPLGYEDVEPPPGADPGHPPYEGGAAAVRDGVSCPARTRTSIA
jgi:hypothetical protein